MTTLIEKLQDLSIDAATLNEEVLLALGWTKISDDVWQHPNSLIRHMGKLYPTEKIDHAIATAMRADIDPIEVLKESIILCDRRGQKVDMIPIFICEAALLRSKEQ